MATHYEILGLAPGATADDIRRAFRRRAKHLHPDTVSGTEAQMQRLNEAYETLKDPQKRRVYDRSITATTGRPGRAPSPAGPETLDPFTFRDQVFIPLDLRLRLAVDALQDAIREVAYDIYDDAHLARFAVAVDAAEQALNQAHRRLFGTGWPSPPANALNLYRQGIRQGDDAIEELRTFIETLDADALSLGNSLIHGARQMLDEARSALTLGWGRRFR